MADAAIQTWLRRSGRSSGSDTRHPASYSSKGASFSLLHVPSPKADASAALIRTTDGLLTHRPLMPILRGVLGGSTPHENAHPGTPGGAVNDEQPFEAVGQSRVRIAHAAITKQNERLLIQFRRAGPLLTEGARKKLNLVPSQGTARSVTTSAFALQAFAAKELTPAMARRGKLGVFERDPLRCAEATNGKRGA